jgi:hypothetical protein
MLLPVCERITGAVIKGANTIGKIIADATIAVAAARGTASAVAAATAAVHYGVQASSSGAPNLSFHA